MTLRDRFLHAAPAAAPDAVSVLMMAASSVSTLIEIQAPVSLSQVGGCHCCASIDPPSATAITSTP